ncbi:hypothetical protein EYF80_063155 [Liparis tanakae]|uniref:Uncharacterized protein n=1 Tax=Liparis tanakae TaxID=230148 RepID=A0A4Z2ED63_9TELE|nr:hypothetical protein EYF80_063155 [Liparis tanakae]
MRRRHQSLQPTCGVTRRGKRRRRRRRERRRRKKQTEEKKKEEGEGGRRGRRNGRRRRIRRRWKKKRKKQQCLMSLSISLRAAVTKQPSYWLMRRYSRILFVCLLIISFYPS